MKKFFTLPPNADLRRPGSPIAVMVSILLLLVIAASSRVALCEPPADKKPIATLVRNLLMDVQDNTWEDQFKPKVQASQQAAAELKQRAREAQSDTPALREALKSDDPKVRVTAAWGLCIIDREAEATAPVLIALLAHPESLAFEVRLTASAAAGDLGPAGRPAAQTLVRQSTIFTRCNESANYLAKVSRESLEKIQPDWISLLADRDLFDPRSYQRIYGMDGVSARSYVVRKLAGVDVRTVTGALHHPDASVREGAVEAIGLIGPSAGGSVSALRELLADADMMVRVKASLALFQVAKETKATVSVLMDCLSAKDDRIRSAAMGAIGAIGPAASPAIPELIRHLNEPGQTGVALAAIGSEALPAVIEAMRSKDVLTRTNALEALIYFRCDCTSAIPALHDLLRDTREELRERAAAQIGYMGPKAAGSWSLIVTAMEGRRISVSTAARTLSAMGPAAREAAPALLKRFELEDANKSMLDVVRALRAIDPPSAAKLVPLLLSGLSRKENRENAITALAALGDVAAPAAPHLLKAACSAEDPQNFNASSAWNALQTIGPAASAIVPDLIGLLGAEHDADIRSQAARTLGAIGPDAAAAIPRLRSAVDDKNPKVRRYAKIALQKIIVPNDKSDTPQAP